MNLSEIAETYGVNPDQWEALMSALTCTATLLADYTPGAGFPPGANTDLGDPADVDLVNLGPLAFVLNEVLRVFEYNGADPNQIIQTIATAAEVTVAAVQAVLDGSDRNPDQELLRAFADLLSISMDVLVDAAKRGGAEYPGLPIAPSPGY